MPWTAAALPRPLMLSSIVNSALINDLGPRLVARSLERTCRDSKRRTGLVLLYHEVGPTQGDRGLEVAPALASATLRAQLEYLKRRYDVVPLNQLRARVSSRGPRERIPVALTFDDDFASHATTTGPLLRGMGIPATFFLTGHSLDGPASFWWEDLQAAADRGDDSWNALGTELAQTAGWECAGADIHQVAYAIAMAPPREHDPIVRRLREIVGGSTGDNSLTAEGVRELVDSGFEIGFHTRHHYFLQALDRKELEQAMRDGLKELEAVAGYRPTAIAYPYCKGDLRVAAAAREAGFELGFVCRNGPVSTTQHPLLLDRVDAHVDALGRFAFRLARTAIRDPIRPL